MSKPTPHTLSDWLELLEVRHPLAIDLGLDRCRAVWHRMGSPRPARSLFVVAGTNGKGSTVATICGLLGALGQRHGSYTTPHLHRYNERIQVLGRPVEDARLLDAFRRVEAARGDVSLTYFEFGTLAAFQILSEESLDHAVMEIGLGGRLDAVNLLDADIAVITPIGLDHQEYLGGDLQSIGREKAGIIRPGSTVICGEPQPPDSVQEVAAKQGARMLRLGVDFRAAALADGVQYEADGLRLRLPRPALPGQHQVGNMATAVAALLQRIPDAAKDVAALDRGLRAVRLAGRFEQLSSAPALWIDVGHNPLGAQAVAATLAEIEAAGDIRACRCVLGMLADKDAPAVAAELSSVISHWYCASLPGPRGQTSARLAARIETAVGDTPVLAFENVERAIDAAMADCAPDEGVLVFGSFLAAAAAGKHWRRWNPGRPGSGPATSRDGC